MAKFLVRPRSEWSDRLRRPCCSKIFATGPSKLGMRCAKWRMKLNPEKTQVDYILQVRTHQKNRTQPKTVWRNSKSISSSEMFRYHFRLPIQFQKNTFEDILDPCNTRYHRLRLPANKKSGPTTPDKNLGKNENNLIFIPLSHK